MQSPVDMNYYLKLKNWKLFKGEKNFKIDIAEVCDTKHLLV